MITLRDYDEAVVLLAQFRARQGFSQTDLARKLGCTPSAVNQREKGDRMMTALTLFAVADALGYDLALIPRNTASTWKWKPYGNGGITGP